jgi:hypothetical protein
VATHGGRRTKVGRYPSVRKLLLDRAEIHPILQPIRRQNHLLDLEDGLFSDTLKCTESILALHGDLPDVDEARVAKGSTQACIETKI